MSKIHVFLDMAMCMLWILTYTFVLIGTIKYRYPLISPITQAIIAPLEFSVLLFFVRIKAFRFDYASIAYVYWTIIEIITITVMIKNEYVQKRHRLPYLSLMMIITCVMIYLVTLKGYMTLFTYFNTFVGVLFWLIFVKKNEDYPIKGLSLAAFTTKFCADFLAIPVYIDNEFWAVKLICILLPLLDFMFIPIYFKRKTQMVK